MDGLPSDLVAYRRSPEFDQNTLPAALQRQHSTKPGVWALIHVVEGKLLYRILDPFGEAVLEPGKNLNDPRADQMSHASDSRALLS
jgi:tellurite resistance-related uncharacterized protein